MIKLAFSINREVFKVTIQNKVIWYSDRKWKNAIQLVPKDEEFIKKIRMSRNKIPAHFTDLFDLTEEERKEYESAKSDEELAEICIQDAKKKGALFLKEIKK